MALASTVNLRHGAVKQIMEVELIGLLLFSFLFAFRVSFHKYYFFFLWHQSALVEMQNLLMYFHIRLICSLDSTSIKHNINSEI